MSHIPFALAQENEDVDTKSEIIVDGDNSILKQSTIMNAPIESVWKAFTTEEGYISWAATHAKIDFRVNGIMETSYAKEFKIGDPQNIKNKILGYVPHKILILKNVQAPSGFAPREVLDKLVSIFEFEKQGDDRTKIIIYGIGYGSDEESKKLMNFFIQGNSWSFQQLHKLFAKPSK